MNNKPIAWLSPDGKVSQTEGKLFYIPLYRAPKPLSDEEILNIYKTAPTNFINFPKETIDFVRAIEERHGIK